MLRRLLVALLLLTTVLGPQWCCCRLRCQLANAFGISQQSNGATRASCCTRVPLERSRREHPGKDHSCPCKQGTRDFALSSSIESAQELQRTFNQEWEAFAVSLLSASDLLESSLCPAFRETLSVASLGGRDLLRTFQVLRC